MSLHHRIEALERDLRHRAAARCAVRCPEGTSFEQLLAEVVADPFDASRLTIEQLRALAALRIESLDGGGRGNEPATPT